MPIDTITIAPSTTAWIRRAVRALQDIEDAGGEKMGDQPLLSVKWYGYDRRLAAHARRLGWVSKPQKLGDGPAMVRILMPNA